MWTRPREASRAAAEATEEEEEEEEADDDDAAETAVGGAGEAAAAPAAARGTSEPAALVAAWPILIFGYIPGGKGGGVCVCGWSGGSDSFGLLSPTRIIEKRF
jgi:hypothetical protein